MKRNYIYIILLVLTFSCSSNVNNIRVQGAVVDESTNPVSKAKVVILCWKDLGILKDDVDYNITEVFTNNQGVFDCEFEKGYKLEIAVKANNYQVNTATINNLHENDTTLVHIVLKQGENKHSAVFFENKNCLTLGLRKCQFDGKELIEEWGVNIEKGENTDNIEDATIWMKDDGNLLALKGSGIIPILDNGAHRSLLNNQLDAPINGYVEKYTITGLELGFFILTKDKKYGKLIMSKPYEKSIPIDEGVCIETGTILKVIYQPDGTNSLEVSQEINLEQLLLDTY